MLIKPILDDFSLVAFTSRLHDDILLLVFILVVSALLSWRVIKFTILPRWFKDDPKELPYWIPVLGHGVAFFNNSHALLNYGRRYFGNSREPFAITAAGSKLYIVTSSEDVAAAYKNTSTLSFEEFVQAMMRISGSSEFVVQKMYENPDPEKTIFPNPHKKPLAKLARELHHNQLFPGEPYDYLRAKIIEYFEETFVLQTIAQYPYARACTTPSHEVVLPLSSWTSDVFVTAGQRAYFGTYLEEVDPKLQQTFIEFDDLTWQVLYQYPKFLSGKMHEAKARLISSLERYFEAPIEKRGRTAWFTPAMEAEMRNLGFDNHDIGVMMTTIYWGINTNTRRMAFWMLSHMLFEPELFAVVREETKAAFNTEGHPNFDYIDKKCPRLTGIWNETMRLSSYSSSVRYITEDMRMGGKILRKGNRVMIPNRLLHFNGEIFGGDVAEFRSRRFVDNASLVRSPSWRPFGGGITMCPGRFVARQAAVTFVAMLVQRYDAELAYPQQWPKIEEGNPVLGIMATKTGEELFVRIKARNGVNGVS